MNHNFCLRDSFNRHWLLFLNHRLEFSPSNKHFVEESNQGILTIKEFEFFYNTLVLSRRFRICSALLFPLEVLKFVKEHLTSSDAFSVKFHWVVFQWKIEDFLSIRVFVLASLSLFFYFLFEIFFESLLSEKRF